MVKDGNVAIATQKTNVNNIDVREPLLADDYENFAHFGHNLKVV